MRRMLAVLLCGLVLVGLAWVSRSLHGERPGQWAEITPGIWRTTEMPYGYALVSDGRALLFDAPHPVADLMRLAKVKQIDAALLTHHHHDTCQAVDLLLRSRIPVRGPRASSEWLDAGKVSKFWADSIPLRNSRTAYFVTGAGYTGLDLTLEDGQTIDWCGWKVKVVATPGHSRDHVAYAASSGAGAPILFCGDALAAPGRLWAPFTTDWDHWTDAGLAPCAQSLRTLAALQPRALYPAHGAAIERDARAALEQTAAAVDEVAFLKSFERFSKQRLGQAPSYPFLVPKEQVGSGGDKPWSKVSEHIYITGNTYVLISKEDRAFAVFDPWGPRSAKQIARLKEELHLGRLELVMFSHAHYDHFDGVYDLPGYVAGAESAFKIWALDQVAAPIADPLIMKAPFLDARPIRFDRLFRDAESGSWREFTFRFHHLPGQSEFTMGVEALIDGKKCYFTADNFFHQDQYSGTGGWMGLNRSWPLPYSTSAQKVLDAAPEWILAEHGGPYVFNAEDYRRRVLWGKASAAAADAVCLSGDHRRDWDPYRVQTRPLLKKARPGARVSFDLIATATGKAPETFHLQLDGRGLTPDQTWSLEASPGKDKILKVELPLASSIPRGRHVFPLRIREATGANAVDAYLAIDVE